MIFLSSIGSCEMNIEQKLHNWNNFRLITISVDPDVYWKLIVIQLVNRFNYLTIWPPWPLPILYYIFVQEERHKISMFNRFVKNATVLCQFTCDMFRPHYAIIQEFHKCNSMRCPRVTDIRMYRTEYQFYKTDKDH
jgi:hypothetical protein